MSSDRTQQIIILIGPPGAGKDTQADLLAQDLGLEHVQSSRIIEEKFRQAAPDDPMMQAEKEKFKSGKLTSSELITRWIIEAVAEASKRGLGIVFSGSPRTLSEAQGELPVLEEHYGKENIHVLNIRLSEQESIKRNSHRRICEGNRHPIPDFPEYRDLTACPRDGSRIITRILDNADTIKVRYRTYLKETEPVLGAFAERGYRTTVINGEQNIRLVHEDIAKALATGHRSSHDGL